MVCSLLLQPGYFFSPPQTLRVHLVKLSTDIQKSYSMLLTSIGSGDAPHPAKYILTITTNQTIIL